MGGTSERIGVKKLWFSGILKHPYFDRDASTSIRIMNGDIIPPLIALFTRNEQVFKASSVENIWKGTYDIDV